MRQTAKSAACIGAPALDDLHAEIRRLELMLGTTRRTIRELDAGVAARDELIAILGTELRNSMGAIAVSASNMIYKAEREPDLPPWLEPRLVTLERQTRNCVRRATTMLDVSRLAKGSLRVERAVVSLSDIVSGVARDLAAEAERAECELCLSIQPGVVGMWDGVAIEQIAINLLSNAIKYGAGRPVEASVVSTGERAVIDVKDHGAGISEVDRARIFERFERALAPRTSKPGLGLGLWITRQLVVAHQGEIVIKSQPGIGSVFTASLPRGINEPQR
jgi:signal transduction histidine kinase